MITILLRTLNSMLRRDNGWLLKATELSLFYGFGITIVCCHGYSNQPVFRQRLNKWCHVFWCQAEKFCQNTNVIKWLFEIKSVKEVLVFSHCKPHGIMFVFERCTNCLLDTINQGRSHRSGWSGFNLTTFSPPPKRKIKK